MRVALSIMPMAMRMGKARRCAARSGGAALPGALLFPAGLRAQTRSQHEDGQPGDHADHAEHRKHGSPWHDHQQQRRRSRHGHFSDIAGEIIGADRLHRARPAEGLRHQRRCQRMLRAGSGPEQNSAAMRMPTPALARRGGPPDSAQCRAKSERRRCPTAHQQPGRNLEARHGAGEQRAHKPELAIAKSELLLPERRQHIQSHRYSRRAAHARRTRRPQRGARIALGRKGRSIAVEALCCTTATCTSFIHRVELRVCTGAAEGAIRSSHPTALSVARELSRIRAASTHRHVNLPACSHQSAFRRGRHPNPSQERSIEGWHGGNRHTI